MLGGYVIEELDVEHVVAQPVAAHPQRRACDLVERCREQMARVAELLEQSRALRST